MILSRRVQPLLRDPEVIDALRDDPELLAIADALYATLGEHYRHRRRWKRRAQISLVVALLASSLAIALVAERQTGRGFTSKALAAIGDRGPVLHLRVRTRVPGAFLVDLTTGRSSPETVSSEFWFNDRTERIHLIVRRGTVKVADVGGSSTHAVSEAGAVRGIFGSLPLYRTLIDFTTDYRAALERKTVRLEGEARIGGQLATVVNLPPRDDSTTQVLVDQSSYRPLLVRATEPSGKANGLGQTVEQIETLPAGEGDFARPRRGATAAHGGAVVGSRRVRATRARDLVSWPVVWPGSLVDSLALTTATLEHLSRYQAGAKRPRAVGIQLLYGAVIRNRPNWRGRFLQIQQSASPEPAYGWLGGVLELAPPPPEGKLRLERLGAAPRSQSAIWRGQLRRGRTYLTLTASERQLVVDAAMQLRRL